MANTTFFQKVTDKNKTITWADVFSEFRKPHNKKDLEYALSAGTSLNSATEADMLSKWSKPWLFFPMLKVGLLLIILCYVIILIPFYFTGSITNTSVLLVTMIPPMIMPIVLMFFIWELNIPKNISIYELLAIFMVGSFISFSVTGMLFPFTNMLFPEISANPNHLFHASLAAFREEPAKLVAGVVCILFLQKKKKIYGITALVIGAIVGTGFSAFESVSYAMNYQSAGIGFMIYVQLFRLVCSIAGHTVMVAPYIGALGLAMQKEGKLTLSCFISKDFLITFGASNCLHFLWNMADAGLFSYVKMVLIGIAFWVELLYILKKCLNEVVTIGRKESSQAIGKNIIVMAISGAIKGAVWMPQNGEALLMGRSEGQFLFPPNTKGVSRKHCSIQLTSQGWTVRDLNSTYGTFVNQTNKLAPGIDWPLKNGDVIYLGNDEQAFQITFQ